MSEPTGLYSNLVPTGSGIPVGGTGMPDVKSLVSLRNAIWDKVLPSGRLKTALLSMDGSIIGVFKTLISLLGSRKYTSNQYTLGERLIDQIQCTTNVGWRDVPDEVVPLARMVMTMLYGVRIWEDNDLNALDNGVAAYKARPDKSDIPIKAVERAVFLRQNFFPGQMNNNACWNIAIFNQYPLVAPVPAMNSDDNKESSVVGKYYNGVGLNGQTFVNGLLAYNSPSTGLTSNLETGSQTAMMSMGTIQKYAPFIAILLVVGLIVSIKSGLYKP